MKYHVLSCAVLAAITSVPSFAGTENPKFTEELIVTAHRVPVPVASIGASVTALDRSDIEAKGQLTVPDLLRSVPGVNVSGSGGYGKSTSLRIRGEDSYRTVVYVDGVKVSDPTGLQISPRMEHLLTADIERIEVLRGPQGMMYGADAGGVIEITTREATAPFEGSVNFEKGRYDTESMNAGIRGKVDAFSYALNASMFETDGFNARSSDTDSDSDGYDNKTYSAKLEWQVTDALNLKAHFRNTDATNEYDTNSLSNVENDFDQETAQLSASLVLGDFTHQFTVSTSDVERQIYENGQKASWGGYYEGSMDQVSYMGTVDLANESALSFGVDLIDYEDKANQSDQEQDGIFLEWRGKLSNNWSYSLGVREDDNSEFGNHTSYRATTAYVQPLAEGNYIKYKAAYGTGFRAPSLYELWYNSASGYAFGAALTEELKIEESKGFDVGVEYHTASGDVFEIVYFDQEIEDYIDFDLDGYTGYLQDEGTSKSRGVELSAEIGLTETLLFTANATYNDTEDPNGDQRDRRPEKIFNVGLQALLFNDSLRLNADVRGVYDNVDLNGEELDDYETLNLSATYFVGEDLEFYIRGENVFSAEYQEALTYNSSTAAVYGGMRFSF